MIDFHKSWIAIAGLILIVTRVILSVVRAYRLRKIMPPGPRGLPLLGNIFQVGELQWFRFTEWKKQYGTVFSLNLAGQPVVVLNDFTSAGDLVDRRSGIYSDRPRFIMASEILTGGMLIAFLGYGDLWRRMRRAAHDGFNARASVSYQPLQEKESALLLSQMLKSPETWEANLKRSAASMVLCSVYGWLPIDASADAFVKRIEQLMNRITYACLPGTYLVEFFPWMLKLPDWAASWKREGLKWFREDTRLLQGLMDEVEVKMKQGGSEPSFAATMLEDKKDYKLSKQEAAWLTGTMVGAGSGSIAGSLSYFAIAMIHYPEVMRRAQAQIDAVVGRDRLPAFSDRDQLPYIEAMVKELLRWRSVGPVGLPRQTAEDDWYKGYFIPKGTLIILNVWAMNRDPIYFPDYDDFRPERYLDDSGAVCDKVPDTHSQGHLTFGAGRRVCVGKDITNQALFINIAAMLWAFNIEAAIGDDGKPVVPSRTECVDEGLVVRPASFKCSIVPRSEKAIEVVHSVIEAYELA